MRMPLPEVREGVVSVTGAVPKVTPELRLVPLKLREANDLVARLHRHHKPVVGHRFSIGAARGDELVGAAIVGRPVSRMLDNGTTAEVTRCVTDGTPNACSVLYAACWRAWRAMGGTRLITYTLVAEPGTSLKAAGWKVLYETKDAGERGWSRAARPRKSDYLGPKRLWEMTA